MTNKLLNRDEFRAALENAIKGKSANKAPFSVAWATGRLSRWPVPERRCQRRRLRRACRPTAPAASSDSSARLHWDSVGTGVAAAGAAAA